MRVTLCYRTEARVDIDIDAGRVLKVEVLDERLRPFDAFDEEGERLSEEETARAIEIANTSDWPEWGFGG